MAQSFPQGCGVPGCTLCAAQPYAPGGLVQAPAPAWSVTYAQGGMIPPGSVTPAQLTYGGPVYAPGSPSRGMDGFDGRAEEDFEPSAGVVTGVRWWGLPAPDLARDPLAAENHWPRQTLRGAKAEWRPGLNEAVCLQGFGHPVPELPCGCGCWAFWREQPYPLGAGIPVLGVIEGSGHALIGELGFRCQRARIAALHVPPAGVTETWRNSLDARPVILTSPSGNLYSYYYEREPESLPDYALGAWLGVISDRLRQLYPDAKVYETRDAMLKLHPPDDPPPAPEPARAQCPFCTARMPAAELAAHAPRCPIRLP